MIDKRRYTALFLWLLPCNNTGLKLIVGIIFCFFLMDGRVSFAQHDLPPDEETEFYYRVLQINGIAGDSSSYSLRPSVAVTAISDRHPWEENIFTITKPVASLPGNGGLYLYSPSWFQSYNTTLPRGRNDGALWQGKGYNTRTTFGFMAKTGPLEIRFRPAFGISQNRSFDLGPFPILTKGLGGERFELDRFAYRHSNTIDFVQRFGDSAYHWFDLGDSSVELRRWGLRLALSNRRLWVGPAVHTALQFGYNAPGFRHVYAGTSKPLDTPIGGLEFSYIFGGVRKSDYYAEEAEEMNSVNAAILIYSPWFDRNLSIGAMRVFYHNYPKSFSEYRDQVVKLVDPGVKSALRTEEDPDVVDEDNQILSFFLRYVFPESGFEFYSEFGRNDANVNPRDLRLQPDHFRAYIIGALKSFAVQKNRLLAVGIEMAQLETPRSSLTRGGGALVGWYTHFRQIPSSTNRGQIMGSGLGPSGNSQMIYAKLYDPRGKIGFTMERMTHNNSAVDQFFPRYQEVNGEGIEKWEIRNIEYMAGFELTAFLPRGFEISFNLDQSFIMNHQYVKDNDRWNTRIGFNLRKQGLNWLR